MEKLAMVSPAVAGQPFSCLTWFTTGDQRGYIEEAREFIQSARKHGVDAGAIQVDSAPEDWRQGTFLKPSVLLVALEWFTCCEPLLFLDADARIFQPIKRLPDVENVGWVVRRGEDLSNTIIINPAWHKAKSWAREWRDMTRDAPREIWSDQQLMRPALEKVGGKLTELPQCWSHLDRLDGEPPQGTIIYQTQASRRRKRL